jgi:hypothetical protein
VLWKLTVMTGNDDLLSAAVALVLQAAHHLTTYDVDAQFAGSLDYGLDRGESECIWLANEVSADLFITDEFNTINYLLVTLALADRNSLFTAPHILCSLATREVLPVEYVAAALTYYVETKGWDAQYVAQLRQQCLRD